MIDYSKWSKQAIFNKIAKHLITQKRRSINKGVCVCYDQKSGDRCAAGCLLPLNWYRKHGDISLSDLLYKTNTRYKYYWFIRDLAEIHDKTKPSRWPEKLRSFARKNGLKIPKFLQKDANNAG